MELQCKIDSVAHRVRLLRVDDQLVHERHQLLQKKIRALDTLDVSKVDSTTLGTHDGRQDNPPRISFVDGWLSVTYPSRNNCAAQLIDCNTATPSRAMRAWTREMLGSVHHFLSLERTILDVWQDLLVCVYVRVGMMIRTEPVCHIELRTISGAHQDPHPLAVYGTLVSAGSPCSGIFGLQSVECKIEVNGDFLAMLKSDRDHRVNFFSLLQVWNWKEGRTTVSTSTVMRLKHR